MNHKMLKRVGIEEPEDGFTDLERQLAELIGNNTVETLYGKLPTNRMKFIVASHFELGYPQDLVAQMLNISQPSLVDEIALIQRVLLGYKYKPYKTKRNQVKLEDVMGLLLTLKE